MRLDLPEPWGGAVPEKAALNSKVALKGRSVGLSTGNGQAFLDPAFKLLRPDAWEEPQNEHFVSLAITKIIS